MSELTTQPTPVAEPRRPLGKIPNKVRRAFLKHGIMVTAIIFTVLAAVYWLVIASDRYVSEAHVIIQRTDLPGGQAMDFSSLLGSADTGTRTDQLLLRDYLLSTDTLRKLDAAFRLRAHYSNTRVDFISRMQDPRMPFEEFYRYYRSMVNVEYDDYAGVLVIKAQAYDAKTAHAIASFLVQEGERFMNAMASNLAREQVVFLQRQVSEMDARATQASQAVVAFQNKNEMVSPLASTETIGAIVAKLEAQRVELETQRSAAQAYLVPGHPTIIRLNQELEAVAQQMEQEKSKLASRRGTALNSTVEEFQRLEKKAALAQDFYRTALVALEKGRLEAARTMKKVSVLQAPTLPEFSVQPRRLYNTLVFMLVALMVAGVAQLIAAIVRDHKD